jgi:flagellum-specific peptidoglycan hydrolase FlgJ
MADYGNPYGGNPYLQMPTQEAPDWRMVLANMATGIGTGLSQAGSTGQGWAAGLAPGIMYGNQLTGMQQQNAEQRAMKRWQLGLQAREYDEKSQDRKLKRDQLTAGASAYVPTGLQPPPPTPTMMSGVAGSAPNRDEFVQTMMPHALEVSKATGLDPRFVIAKAALETGWGRAAPGNNYFGIKSHGRAGGQVLPTNEVGPGGEQYTLNQSFRTYANPGESAKDYAEFLKTNGRYAPVLQAQGLDAQIEAIGKSGYATDPQYAAKLRQIAQGLPSGGAQPANAGGQGGGEGAVQPVQYAVPPTQPRAAVSDAPPTLTLPQTPTLDAATAQRLRTLHFADPARAAGEYKQILETQQQEAKAKHDLAVDAYKHRRGQADKDAWEPLDPKNASMYPGLEPSKAYLRNRVTGEVKPIGGAQVQIDMGGKAVTEIAKQRVQQYEEKIRPAAQAAVSEIESTHRFRQLLDAGAFTGVGADAKLLAARVADALGLPSDKADNTQALMAAAADRVLASIKSLGANPTDSDRIYLEKAKGGNITFSEGALRKILDISEKQARSTVKKHGEEVGRIRKLDGIKELPDEFFSLSDAPDYGAWSKENPLAAPAAPAAPPVNRPPISSFGREVPPQPSMTPTQRPPLSSFGR